MPDMMVLKARMLENHVDVPALARRLNINKATVYRKIKKPESFTVREVIRMIEFLNLTMEDVEKIFR